MRRGRRDVEPVAGGQLSPLAGDLDMQRAGEDLEVLRLCGVVVRRGGAPPGA
jgi:hypothetical protein